MWNSSVEELQKVLEKFKPLYQELCFRAGKFLNDEDVGKNIVLSKFDKFCKMGLFKESEVAIRKQLFTAVWNGCIDHFRKLKRQEEGFAQWVENIDPGGQPESPENKMFKDQLYAELKRMIAELEPRFRAVITGRYMEELEVKDLAVRLGISESSVYNHLARGVEMLRERIKQRIPEAMNLLEQFFDD
jgi:RNA polymerase sigma factor (sigma-70 family)